VAPHVESTPVNVESTPANSVDSAIHDIGYQRYQGPRLGRAFAVRSLYVHSLRAAFGIGRGAKAKIFPWLIIAVALLYAIVVVAVRTLSDQVLVTYRGYASGMSYPVMMFLAIIAPELVSRDLRDKVLPLYFSRPLRRADYALTKLAAMVSAVLLLVAVPQVLIYIGAVFSKEDGLWSAAWHELRDLAPGLVAAGTYALVLSGLSLLVASLTGRRAFAAAGVVAVFLVTTPVVGILYAIGGSTMQPTMQQLAFLANPMTAVGGLLEWLYGPDVNRQALIGDFGPVYGLSTAALVVLAVALLLARYRRVPS
jgi:ABC-2 type transport system permease protein